MYNEENPLSLKSGKSKISNLLPHVFINIFHPGDHQSA
jgi:hypothetical protein